MFTWTHTDHTHKHTHNDLGKLVRNSMKKKTVRYVLEDTS